MSGTPRLSDALLDKLLTKITPLGSDFVSLWREDVRSALAELRALRAIAREIGSNTPTLDDERLPYVEVQIDRGSWEEVRSYAK